MVKAPTPFVDAPWQSIDLWGFPLNPMSLVRPVSSSCKMLPPISGLQPFPSDTNLFFPVRSSTGFLPLLSSHPLIRRFFPLFSPSYFGSTAFLSCFLVTQQLMVQRPGFRNLMVEAPGLYSQPASSQSRYVSGLRFISTSANTRKRLLIIGERPNGSCLAYLLLNC